MITKTAVILIEDKLASRRLLESYIVKNDTITLLKSFSKLTPALEFIIDNPKAILLLDIELGRENAISVLKDHFLPNPIIFVTSFKEYGADAFNFNVKSYLIKPITRIEFENSVRKVIHQIQAEEVAKNQEDKVKLYVNRVHTFINPNEIIYIESRREYLIYHDLYKEEFSLLQAFNKVDEKFTKLPFIRIHKSYIININFINTMYKDEVTLKNQVTIPIGRTYKSMVRKFLL